MLIWGPKTSGKWAIDYKTAPFLGKHVYKRILGLFQVDFSPDLIREPNIVFGCGCCTGREMGGRPNQSL